MAILVHSSFTIRGYAWAKPLVTKADVGLAAYIFAPRVGMPEDSTTNGAQEFGGPKTKFHKFFTKQENGCKLNAARLVSHVIIFLNKASSRQRSL